MAAANGLAVMLSFLSCSLGAISPDGLGVDYQPRLTPRLPPTLRLPIRNVPTRTSYVTRHSLTLAVRFSTTLFT